MAIGDRNVVLKSGNRQAIIAAWKRWRSRLRSRRVNGDRTESEDLRVLTTPGLEDARS
jgi:hypothetical protein